MLFNTVHLRWLLNLVLRRLGLWGLSALGIACLSGVLFYTEYVRIHDALEATEAALLQIDDTKPETLVDEMDESNLTDKQMLDDFYSSFPTINDVPDILSALYRTANKHHIYLNTGDYKLNKVKQQIAFTSANIAQYEMVLPIEGSYPDIRRLMSNILAEYPSIAISDIQLKREDTQIPFVEARLVLVLFVRGEQA